jgi:phosphopantothenoylcysteine decarboxylase / phosphopantothenate---cysteine ligase
MLFRKKIILAVTGSIAAYKSAPLTRLLVKAGADVRVILTNSAKDFVTPLTLSTLSKNPVHSSFTLGEQGEWVNHVELGLWADAIIVAPASANTLSYCANGLANNLLAAVYLSARCPVFFAPAMDLDMWKHPSTQRNIAALRSYGNYIMEPASGELASGLVGEGRMMEPEDIVERLESFFNLNKQLKGRRILITAGPTQEAIDPVRYISNHSSGKMGYALAEELAERGAEVVLVSGPVNLKTHHPTISVISVTTAEEMRKASVEAFPNCHAAILAAAVADFKADNVSGEKLKKKALGQQLNITGTADILLELSRMRVNGQILGGFALETQNGKANAEEKLNTKNLDFIVLNEFNNENQVFGSDFNTIQILSKRKGWQEHGSQTKVEAARDVADLLNDLLKHDA